MLVLNILGNTIKLNCADLKQQSYINIPNFTGTIFIPKKFLKEKYEQCSKK